MDCLLMVLKSVFLSEAKSHILDLKGKSLLDNALLLVRLEQLFHSHFDNTIYSHYFFIMYIHNNCMNSCLFIYTNYTVMFEHAQNATTG